MKKIIIIATLMIGCMSVKAQFPTTDSLRAFINRYIRNSAVEAFQNLRLNTALIGMTNYVDSAYGGQVVSFTAPNDSTARLILLSGDTLSIILPGRAVQPTIDVFMIGGQSNAMGVGDSTLSPKVPVQNVLQVNTGVITPANDPVGQNIGTSGNRAVYGSAWPAFGNAYYSITGKNIAFIPSSRDGSSQAAAAEYLFGTWDTTGVLFDSAIARINSGMNALRNAGYDPVFKGILWCQGEADGKAINRGLMTQADYIAALKKMIGRFRNSLSLPQMPFYIFRTGTKTDTLDAGYKQIRDAQQIVANIDTFNTKIVFYNAIDFPARGMMHDVAHFTQAGYNEMGRQGAAAVVSGRVFNVDDVLITENNKLKADREVDLNGKNYSIKDYTTGYNYLNFGSYRVNANRTVALADSIIQDNIVAKNVFRSKTFFGDRTIEGTPYNYFVDAPVTAYTEGYQSANELTQTASLAPARYFRLNDGSRISRYPVIYSQAIPRLRGTDTMYADGGNAINSVYAHQFNYVFTRASDYTAPPVIVSDTTAAQSNTNFNLSFGLFGTGLITANGWYSNYSSQLSFTNTSHSLQNFADAILGKVYYGSAGTIPGKRVGLYILPIKQSWVNAGYSIYQQGTSDTNYLAGIIRTPNIAVQNDTTNYKPVVADASGNHYKMAGWPGSGGGAVSSVSNSDGSLTISPTTGGVVGSLNTAHPNTFTAQQNITVSGQTGMQINMSNTADGTYGLNINRSGNNVENAFNFSTANTPEWFFGENNDGTSDFLVYNWTANKVVWDLEGTTGNIKFGNSLNALVIKNDGTGISANSLTGTGSRVLTSDASGNISALSSSGTSGQVLTSNGTSAPSFQTLVLKGTTTWDPASISANSSTSTSFTVTGAALGDPVTVSKVSGAYSNGEVYFAYVSATNTVTIQLQNTSGASFNITSDTFNVVVLKY